jgi:hypothetical protein
VPEGSPTDPPAETVTEETTTTEEVVTEARSPEEIEAIWKNRVSQKDIAHAAEAKALREQLAAAEARVSAKAAADLAGASGQNLGGAEYQVPRRRRTSGRDAGCFDG